MPEDKGEWIRHRVEGLTEDAELLYEVCPDVVNDFDTWSALKLIFLSSAVNMFTKVAANNFQNIFYIDALAGSGITEHRGGEYFVGSPILAMRASYNPFTKMYFIEEDGDYADALECRLNYLEENRSLFETPPENPPDDWEVIQGDTNEELPRLKGEMWDEGTGETRLYLTFIDNQGMNVMWDAIEEIGENWGDFLINFPTGQAARNVRPVKKGHDINKFTGLELHEMDLPSKNVREWLLGKYREEKLGKLDPPRSRQVRANIVSGKGSYEYDLIYAARDKTSGDFLQSLEYTKEFVENFDGTDLDPMMDIIHGDQSALNPFLPDPQSGLGDFE